MQVLGDICLFATVETHTKSHVTSQIFNCPKGSYIYLNMRIFLQRSYKQQQTKTDVTNNKANTSLIKQQHRINFSLSTYTCLIRNFKWKK